MIALHSERRPAHEELFIRGLNGVRRHLEVVAIQYSEYKASFLGAVALFWGARSIMRVTLYGTRGSIPYAWT